MEENVQNKLLNKPEEHGYEHYETNKQTTSTSLYSKRKQVLATLFATLGCLLNGAVIGYTGPAIPSLMNTTGMGNNVYGADLVLGPQEASWITGLLSIGCFVGCIVAGPCMERFGRRITLMIVTSSAYLLGFIFILLASNVALIFIGRFLTGMGLGFVLATAPVYIVEIATTDMRGLLGCFVQFFGGVGVLFSFILGAFLNWWQLAGAMIVMIVPFVIGMVFAPESPRWLFLQGRDIEAHKSLEWLRGKNQESVIALEVAEIRKENKDKLENKVTAKDLLEPATLRPFMITLTMYFFLNMSGMNIMIFYCNSIFFYSGSNIDSNVASIIVAIILLFSSFIAIGIITKLNRKIILISSMFGMGVCYVILGGCFYHIEKRMQDHAAGLPAQDNQFGWVPPLTILTLLFLGNGGYGTLIWVVIAELLPPKVRAIGNAFIICFGFILGFIVSKTFVDLTISIGASGTFWLYAGVCLLGSIFTFFCVPETKGKSIEEIQRMFTKSLNNEKSETI